MPIHVTWDITFGTILSITVFLGITIPLFLRLGSVLRVFGEYPPHRHVNGHILYPRGMRPGDED